MIEDIARTQLIPVDVKTIMTAHQATSAAMDNVLINVSLPSALMVTNAKKANASKSANAHVLMVSVAFLINA